MAFEKKIKKGEDKQEIYFSKFLVVDLTESEKGMELGRRREKGVNINKSIFALEVVQIFYQRNQIWVNLSHIEIQN